MAVHTQRAYFETIALVGLFFAASCTAPRATPATQPALLLTNAAQIRSLTAEQAAQAIPVRLVGVVVDVSHPRERAVILANDGVGIYLLATTNLFSPYHRGDLLDIQGVTSPGEFAPCVLTTNARKLGAALPPRPRVVTYHQLLTGAMDAQFVELVGVVRYIWPQDTDPEFWTLLLGVDGGSLPVRLSLPRDPRIQVDARIRVQAVCLYRFNQKRQNLGPVLQVPRGVPVHIEAPAPDDPFATPPRPAVSLVQFAPDIAYLHRVRVRGIVTHAQAPSMIWIRDNSGALRIYTRQDATLQPGDELDLLGFPRYGSSTPILEDAVYRKTGSRSPPTPYPITHPLEAYDHHDDLVAIEAELVALRPTLDGLALSLHKNDLAFKAVLALPEHSATRPSWTPGSVLRVSGICNVIDDDSRPVMGLWQPKSFQILLRTPADVTTVRAPPWWSPTRIMLSLTVTAALSLLAATAITLHARHRLRQQARHRAMAEYQFAAVLAERNRMARELHDTLAQGLTAALLHLRLAKKHATAASAALIQHINVAQELLTQALQEARNSIWFMRSQVLETNTLAAALKNILTQTVDGTGIEARFHLTGRERRLAPVIENNILRIGQEAITNAAKHAAPKHISVTCDYGERHFSLVVADDGQGFDPSLSRSSHRGFGLLGMHERAMELHGQLDIRSAPNQGTTVTLCVPLPAS